MLVQPVPIALRPLAHKSFKQEKAAGTEHVAHLFETAARRTSVVQRVARVHQVEACLGKVEPLSVTDAGANRVANAVAIKELAVDTGQRIYRYDRTEALVHGPGQE